MESENLMKKMLLGILAVILLLVSFPVRSYCGTMVSDIIRLLGFILLIVFIVLKIHWSSK